MGSSGREGGEAAVTSREDSSEAIGEDAEINAELSPGVDP